MKRRRSYVVQKTVALGLATCVAVASSDAQSDEQETKKTIQRIPWSYGELPANYQTDLAQCGEALSFVWNTHSADASAHDLWQFDSEASFHACDFANATPLIDASSSPQKEFAIANDHPLPVGQHWFGSSTGVDCQEGNMKIAVQIRPQYVHEHAECVGGILDLELNESSIESCRKRCKERSGCLAIDFRHHTGAESNCRLFLAAPEFGDDSAEPITERRNFLAQCEIAATSCDNVEDEGTDAVDKADSDVINSQTKLGVATAVVERDETPTASPTLLPTHLPTLHPLPATTSTPSIAVGTFAVDNYATIVPAPTVPLISTLVLPTSTPSLPPNTCAEYGDICNIAASSPCCSNDQTCVKPKEPFLMFGPRCVFADPPKRTKDSLVTATLLAQSSAYRSSSDVVHQQTKKADLKLSVSQITFGNNHHLFGYIGHCLTIPWNGDDRYIVSLQTDFHDHLPRAHEAARIILIDTWDENYKVEILDETHAWNLQQGTMLYWNPHADKTQFFFNDRDLETNKVFTVLYDIELRKRVREYRFNYPVANGGVCPKGGFFYAVNYGRMARLRPVTGYHSAYDWTVGQRDPANDGVWKVDIETGEQTLLASFKDIAQLLKVKSIDYTPEAELYINHSLSSRDCTKIYFFARGQTGRRQMEVNESFVMESNGNGLKMVKYIGGHPEWVNEDVLFGKEGRDVILYDVERETVAGKLGANFDDALGDLALSSNYNMFVNGSEDSKWLYYHFVRLTDGAEAKTMPMSRGPWSGGTLRIDAAPRWNRAGNKVLIPGWKDGYRQLHIIDVEGAE